MMRSVVIIPAGGILYLQYSYSILRHHLIKPNPVTLVGPLIHALILFLFRVAISQGLYSLLLIDLPRLREQEINGVRILLRNLHDLALQPSHSALN